MSPTPCFSAFIGLRAALMVPRTRRHHRFWCTFLLLLNVCCWQAASAMAEDIQFPANAGHLNVRDFGAKGDGVNDDTQAFNNAIAQWTFCGGHANNFRFLYIPNGTYLVSGEVFWMRWLVMQGQSEAGTIIKLKDNHPDYQDPANPKPVLRCRFLGQSCSPWDGSNNSSFSNYIQNLTVNTGAGNPGAIGIRYNNHNGGAIRNVTVKSGDANRVGNVGIDMAETEFGPGLVKDVTVNGFDTGILLGGYPSHATLENITVKYQKVVGVENYLPVSINRLTSVNTVPGFRNRSANGVLLNGSFKGGAPGNSAIVNTSGAVLYARNITSVGYGAAVDNDGTKVASPVSEFIAGGEKRQVFPSPVSHLQLPIESPPAPFDEPMSNWAYVDPSGSDDTQALQAAIDGGASTIYLNFTGGYNISNTVFIRGNVKRIVGMNATIQADPGSFNSGAKPMFVVQTTQPLTVEFLRCQQYAEPVYKAVEVQTTQPVYFKSVSMSVSSGTRGYIVNTATAQGGKIFLEDTHEQLKMLYPTSVWARHYNPENNPAGSSTDHVYAENNGGNLWILGYKTEGIATHAYTRGGGKTEVMGGFFRDHISWAKDPALFVTEESSISASYFTYDWDGTHSRTRLAKETRGGITKLDTVNAGSHAVVLYSGYGSTAATLRAPDNPANATPGLNYAYYEGSWSALPDFGALTALKTGTVTGFDLSLRNRNDQFGFRYSGYVEVPTDGQYTFHTSSDDGSKLFIGNQLVVDNDGLHATQERSGTIGLRAGKHAITVVFFEQGGEQVLDVRYQGPGLVNQAVPATALFKSAAAGGTRVANNAAAQSDAKATLQLAVYPAPVMDGDLQVQITAQQGGPVQLTLRNLSGQRVASHEFNATKGINRTAINVCHLPVGVYVLQVGQGPQRVTQKILIQ
jgi:Pectate lyase superfamily protein/PA14 domain/Secretion system C-terminal sorting domain